MKPKIISFVLALLISVGLYIVLYVDKSMCYYSIGGLPSMSTELMEAIRNKCYANFSIENIILRIIFGFVISFLATYGLWQLISEWRKNKSIT